ncbi:hypothetical protein NUACC26_069470 [Scytonema sp. NUACC26]
MMALISHLDPVAPSGNAFSEAPPPPPDLTYTRGRASLSAFPASSWERETRETGRVREGGLCLYSREFYSHRILTKFKYSLNP